MSDQHWAKIMGAVSYYALDNGIGLDEVETLLDLMQSKRARLLNEALLDRYIEKQKLEQEKARLITQQTNNQTKIDEIGEADL